MKRRRILVAHPVPGLYGADRMMLTVMQVLHDAGAEVTFVVPETGPLLPYVERAGITTRLLSFPVLRKALLRPLPLLRLAVTTPWHLYRIWRMIRLTEPDLIYVNTITLPHWLVAARLARVPAICHVREAEAGMRPALARLLLAPLRLAAVVVTNSADTGGWLSEHRPRLTDRVRVIYNGFDFGSAAAAGPGEPGRLVVVGRLSPRKGQDVALEAMALLVAQGRDVRLHLVGDVFRGYEWYEDQLRADIVRLGLSTRVFLDGFCVDPTASYRAAEIVLVPSRLEPFGNVAVEAMALGRPVVATRVGGLPEIVDDELTGLLCPPGDPVALARTVARLLDDAGLAARLSTAGAGAVRQRFGIPRLAEDLLAATDAATSPALSRIPNGERVGL